MHFCFPKCRSMQTPEKVKINYFQTFVHTSITIGTNIGAFLIYYFHFKGKPSTIKCEKVVNIILEFKKEGKFLKSCNFFSKLLLGIPILILFWRSYFEMKQNQNAFHLRPRARLLWNSILLFFTAMYFDKKKRMIKNHFI